jgi:hypothetical protein
MVTTGLVHYLDGMYFRISFCSSITMIALIYYETSGFGMLIRSYSCLVGMLVLVYFGLTCSSHNLC